MQTVVHTLASNMKDKILNGFILFGSPSFVARQEGPVTQKSSGTGSLRILSAAYRALITHNQLLPSHARPRNRVGGYNPYRLHPPRALAAP